MLQRIVARFVALVGQLLALQLLQRAIFAHLRHHWMIVLHIDERHFVRMRFDARLAPQHGELRAAPVDDALAAHMPIKDVLVVAELARAIFGHDKVGHRVFAAGRRSTGCGLMVGI